MRAPAVVVTPCRALSNDEHVRAGAALARATGDRRVAFIASADHGHGHSADGPYGFAPESKPYDDRIVELVDENRLAELAGVGPGRRRDREGGQLLAAPDAARRDRRRLSTSSSSRTRRRRTSGCFAPRSLRGRTDPRDREVPRMVRKKRPHKMSPKNSVARQETAPRRRRRRTRHHHPELVGPRPGRPRRLPRGDSLVRLQRRPRQEPRRRGRSAPPPT